MNTNTSYEFVQQNQYQFFSKWMLDPILPDNRRSRYHSRIKQTKRRCCAKTDRSLIKKSRLSLNSFMVYRFGTMCKASYIRFKNDIVLDRIAAPNLKISLKTLGFSQIVGSVFFLKCSVLRRTFCPHEVGS